MTTLTSTPDRIDLRLQHDDKNLLQLAASHEGISVAAFIRKASLEAARSVVERNDKVRFTRQEMMEIIAALDKPFVPNEALKRAMREAEEIEKNSAEPC